MFVYVCVYGVQICMHNNVSIHNFMSVCRTMDVWRHCTFGIHVIQKICVF